MNMLKKKKNKKEKKFFIETGKKLSRLRSLYLNRTTATRGSSLCEYASDRVAEDQ
jgi:hypothetical protein